MPAYTSRDDARSDLFLAGAVYVFGPLVVGILLQFIPLQRIRVVDLVLNIAMPLLFTVLVPVLLMRYRGETMRDLGIAGGDPSVGVGILAALPLLAASLIVAFVARGDLLSGLPIVVASGDQALGLLGRMVFWVGLAFLALYGTVKARDAFGGNPVSIAEGVVRIGRILAIAGAVATVLLLLTLLRGFDLTRALTYVLMPLGVAGAVVFVLQRLGSRSVTTLPTLVTPVALLAIGAFTFGFDALSFVAGVYSAALYAGIGLVIAIMVERTQRGVGVLVLGLAIALLTTL